MPEEHEVIEGDYDWQTEDDERKLEEALNILREIPTGQAEEHRTSLDRAFESMHALADSGNPVALYTLALEYLVLSPTSSSVLEVGVISVCVRQAGESGLLIDGLMDLSHLFFFIYPVIVFTSQEKELQDGLCDVQSPGTGGECHGAVLQGVHDGTWLWDQDG